MIDERGAWVTSSYGLKIYLGEPSNIIRMLNEMRADEVSISWVGKNSMVRDNFLRLISAQASMPLSYGGGIRSGDDALEIVRLGFEKVTLTTAFILDPSSLSGVASRIGRSSIAVKIPLRRVGGELAVWDWRSGRLGPRALSEYLQSIDRSQVSEVVVSMVDLTGSKLGFDHEAVHLVTSSVSVLNGYEGGVAEARQVEQLWDLGVDGVYSSSLISTYGAYSAPLTFYPAIRPERYSS